MSDHQTVADIVKLMREDADSRDGPTTPPQPFNEMMIQGSIAEQLRLWADRLELVLYGDLASAFERSKSMKRVVSPTGTVHIVEQDYQHASVAPEYQDAKITMCHYKNGDSAYDVFWDFTEKNATCMNCLRALERET